MVRWLREWSAEIAGFAILTLFLWITQGRTDPLNQLRLPFPLQVPASVETFSTLFLSIFIEGIPFILIGVLVSALIQVYVREETIWRLIPRKRIFAIPMAATLGIFLPVCECGIVPITKRLIQKGMPTYTAFTFLLAAPVINPVTITSTYIAFGSDWNMTVSRMALTILIACTMGFLISIFLSGNPLRENRNEHHCCEHRDKQRDPHHPNPFPEDRLGHALYHGIFEFMNMGKYFVAGAAVAALFQTWIGLSAIHDFAQYGWVATLFMMGLAFGLSLCVSADAFVAASFRSVMPSAPVLAFLVFGPIMDLKNLLMMAGNFRPKVVRMMFVGTFVLTLVAVELWKTFGF